MRKQLFISRIVQFYQAAPNYGFTAKQATHSSISHFFRPFFAVKSSHSRQNDHSNLLSTMLPETTKPEDGQSIWVFGYGSLIWKTNFPFSRRSVGYIKSYSRKFWQGSTDHRGVPGKPGRVVTLIEEEKAVTWGVAYQVLPESVPEVMAYLDHREKGGYSLQNVQFYPKDGVTLAFKVLVYIANESNDEYLGDAPLEQIAKQIATSRGPSGENSEYLLRLAMAVRELGVHDDHLFELEKRVTEELINNRIASVEKACHSSEEEALPHRKLLVASKQNSEGEE